MSELPVAKWMRPVELQSNSTRIRAVTQVANEYAKGTSPAVVLELASVAFFGEDNPAHAALSQALRQHDETYWAEAGEAQARIIAGIILAGLMRSDGNQSTVTSHAVLCAAWRNLDMPFEDLADEARQALHRNAVSSRERAEISFVDITKAYPKKPELPGEGDYLNGQQANEIVKYVNTSMVVLQRQFNKMIGHLSDHLDASDEELNILWWAFSGRSRLLDVTLAAPTAPGQVAVAAGLELELLIRFAEEPVSVRQVLERLLARKTNRPVSIQDAIAPLASADYVVPGGSVGSPLLPILTCLSEMKRHNGQSTWKAAVSQWAIDLEYEVTPTLLATQTIREALLARQLSG